MIVILTKKPTEEELKQAAEVFGDYIKVTADIKKGIVAAGGKLHADGEKVLLEMGSNQEDIWGGGFDLTNQRVDTQAMINIRPNRGNDSMEILDSKIREEFVKITERVFK